LRFDRACAANSFAMSKLKARSLAVTVLLDGGFQSARLFTVAVERG
jgi:hypothetical protein